MLAFSVARAMTLVELKRERESVCVCERVHPCRRVSLGGCLLLIEHEMQASQFARALPPASPW